MTYRVDVADTLASAAGRLNLPLADVKKAKRNGSPAFRNGRVHLDELSEELRKPEFNLCDFFLSLIRDVARIVAGTLPEAEFRSDVEKLTERISIGFSCALLALQPNEVDTFLKKSSAIFESVFEKPAHKRRRRESNQRKRMTTTKVEALRR